MAREVGLPLMRGLLAWARGDGDAAAEALYGVRTIAARFGGSHAQRDIIDLTLLEAALRSGDHGLAQTLAAERADAKHDSPLAAMFAKRAGLPVDGAKAA